MLLHVLLGLLACTLIVTGLTLAVAWIVRRDLDRQHMRGYPVAGWCEACHMWASDIADHLARRHPDLRDTGSTRLAVTLLGLTIVLVAWGAVLYTEGQVGWAQLSWVVASGSAGAGVMSWVER